MAIDCVLALAVNSSFPVLFSLLNTTPPVIETMHLSALIMAHSPTGLIISAPFVSSTIIPFFIAGSSSVASITQLFRFSVRVSLSKLTFPLPKTSAALREVTVTPITLMPEVETMSV